MLAPINMPQNFIELTDDKLMQGRTMKVTTKYDKPIFVELDPDSFIFLSNSDQQIALDAYEPYHNRSKFVTFFDHIDGFRKQ